MLPERVLTPRNFPIVVRGYESRTKNGSQEVGRNDRNYEAEKIDGVKTQRVKIVYNCVGTVSVPNTDNEPVKTDKTKIIEVA